MNTTDFKHGAKMAKALSLAGVGAIKPSISLFLRHHAIGMTA